MSLLLGLFAITVFAPLIFIPIFATPPSLYRPYEVELILDRAPNLGDTGQITILGTKIDDLGIFFNQTLPLGLSLPSGFELVTTDDWMEIPQPGSDYKRFEKQFFPDEQSIMVNATIKAVKNGNWTIYGDVFSVRNAKYLVVSNNDSYIHDGPFLPLSITSTRALVCPMIIDFDTGNFHYLMDIIPTSPLKQYECGIPIEKIQCNDKLILLQKLSDESISCVTLDTSMSLVERGWGQYLQYPNSEEINYGKDMMELIEYTVRGASDISIKPDAAAKSLIIEIATVADGNLNISIPKMLANMMFGPNTSIGNDSFFVLVDGAEVDYEEKPATKAYRNLAIPFEIGNTQIEIIGTYP